MRNKENILKEGDVLFFDIINELILPGNNDDFFILKDPFNIKYLLPIDLYKDYDLKVNQSVKCRVDKINCTGKIFLEPEHPVYKEGEVYDFDFIKKSKIMNSQGKVEKILIIKDCFQHKINLPYDPLFIINSKTKKISCKIQRIKKARLLLVPTNNNYNILLKVGTKYRCIVKDIITLSDGNEYYKVKDKSKMVHYFRKKHYESYNFKLNQNIECIAYKNNRDNTHYLEPVHPYYEIGKVYTFKLIGSELNKTVNNEDSIEIIVSDKFSQEIKFVDNEFDLNIKSQKIKCKVEDIKKGRVFLSRIENK